MMMHTQTSTHEQSPTQQLPCNRGTATLSQAFVHALRLTHAGPLDSKTHNPPCAHTHTHTPNLIKRLSRSPPRGSIMRSPSSPPLPSLALMKYIIEDPFIIMEMPLSKAGGGDVRR